MYTHTQFLEKHAWFNFSALTNDQKRSGLK